MGKKNKPVWYAQGVSVAWLSTMWEPRGPVLEYGGDDEDQDEMEGMGRPVAEVIEEDSEPDDSYWAMEDLRKDPAWKAWFKEHLRRDDVFPMLNVDEIPAAKFTQGYSRKTGNRTYTYWLPVQAFLAEGQTVRDVVRAAYVTLYQHIAKKLELPAPRDPGPHRKKVAA